MSEAATLEARLAPTDSIVVDKDRNARKKYVGIEDLAEKIRVDGLINPLLVEALPKDRWALRAGYRRYYACCHLKMAAIPVREWTPNLQREETADEQRFYVNLGENTDRRNLTTYELATACVDLRRRYRRPPKYIAGRLKIGSAYVVALIRRRERLHPTILEAWEIEHPAASLERLWDLALLPPFEQVERWTEITGRTNYFPGALTTGQRAPRRWSRPRQQTMEKVIAALERSDHPPEARRLAVQTARFAMGDERSIPGIYKLPE